MPLLEVYGNWGTLYCDAETGMVINYDYSDSDWEKPGDGYEDIVRVDVNAWREKFPGQDITEHPRDIVYFNLWSNIYGYQETDWED